MLLTNSWITTLLIIEKGTGVNANISAGIGASSNNGSDYGAVTAVTDCRNKKKAFKVVYIVHMLMFSLVVLKSNFKIGFKMEIVILLPSITILRLKEWYPRNKLICPRRLSDTSPFKEWSDTLTGLWPRPVRIYNPYSPP